ncbi:hypothetical protein [Nocardia sp. NPDC005998]|uniref:hypothetical protein n=1 Tax=Nocardia sp. NPDC005998 TaxID=3156894 RepID=UPI0033AE0791
MERRYRLRRERAVIDADQAASAAPEDHRGIFATAKATPLGEFNAYLDRENADPAADLVGSRQCERAVIDADQAASAAPEDHRRIFATAKATPARRDQHCLDHEKSYPATALVGPAPACAASRPR